MPSDTSTTDPGVATTSWTSPWLVSPRCETMYPANGPNSTRSATDVFDGTIVQVPLSLVAVEPATRPSGPYAVTGMPATPCSNGP